MFGNVPILGWFGNSVPFDLFHQTASKTNVGVAEGSLIGGGVGLLSIPKDSLLPGDMLFIKMEGFYTRTAGNITFRSKLAGNIQASSALSIQGATNGSFVIEVEITIRSIGILGTAISQGRITSYNNAGQQTGNDYALTPQTTTFNIDTTIANTYDLTSQFSVVGAVNSITSTNFSISKTRT